MLDMGDIEAMINELETGEITPKTCDRLASLYIVRDAQERLKIAAKNAAVEREYRDVLPEYKGYVETKRKYQLGEVGEKAVENALRRVCKEITEFMVTLYQSTDTPEERNIIEKALVNFELR